MKNFMLAVLAILGGTLVFFSLPLTSVATLTITVFDQDHQKITTDINATYFDRDGNEIIEITPQTRGSWDNNLHWWTHSSHQTSMMRPQAGLRATSTQIKAKGCKSTTISVTRNRQYQPLRFSLHGGGTAYLIYNFKQTVVLNCK